MSNTKPSAFFWLTAEVRWFQHGRIPQKIQDWFTGSPFPLTPSTRTDRYLVYPASEQTGVKFREQRFEIKTLVRVMDLLEVGDQIIGSMELWEKWSMEAESVPQLFRDLSESGDRWVDVTKTRWMRVFDTSGKAVNEGDPSDDDRRPEEGCYAEITEVAMGGQTFWTLGLESFARNQSLQENLVRTAQLLLQPEAMPICLNPGDAIAYPGFLRKYFQYH